jgi:hypothetical protein
VVTFTANLAMSIAEFSTSSREAYVDGVAEALNVASSSVAIASVAEQFTRRRLLASALAVATTATVTKDKALSVIEGATAENLNTALASSGISVGTVSARTIAAQTTTDDPALNDPASSGDTNTPGPGSDAIAADSGPSMGLIAGAAGAAGVLALLVGVWVWWQVCRREGVVGTAGA